MSNVYVGSKEFKRKIQKAAQVYKSRAEFLKGDGLRPVMREMGEDIIQQYHTKISSFNPGKVADLREGYKKEKLRNAGFLYPILLRTGQMLASFNVRVVHSGSKWTVYVTATGSNIQHNGRVVSNDQLVEWHVAGTARMKARDFTKKTKAWVEKWQGKVKKAIRRGYQGG